MNLDIEPYENTLTIEELRRELRRELDDKHAFWEALREAPDMPPPRVLLYLSHAARWPEDNNIGRGYQIENPGTVPYKSECEGGAGVWIRIRDGLRAPTPQDGETR